MKALLWVGGILLLLLLLGLLRLRVSAVYGEEGPSVTVSLGALPLLRLPGKKKRPAPEKKKKKPKEKGKAAEGHDRGGSVPGFRALMPIISQVLGKLKRRLGIDELTLWYLSAGEDPAAAALLFGGASAAAGALLQPLTERLHVRKTDLRTAVSFTETKPRVFACLRFSLALGALLRILLGAVRKYRKIRRGAEKKGDKEESSWKSTPSEN